MNKQAKTSRKKFGAIAAGLGLFFAVLAGLSALLLPADGEWRMTLVITFSALGAAGIIGGILHRFGVIDLSRQGEWD